MRRIVWSLEAQSALDKYLATLHDVDPALSRRMLADLDHDLLLLRNRPYISRVGRWPGCREWSMPRWRKVLMLRVIVTELQIVAFFDARQNIPGENPQD